MVRSGTYIFGLVGLDSCDGSGIRLVFGEVLGVICTYRSHPLEGVLDVLSDFEDEGRGTLVVGVLVGCTATIEVQTFSRYLGRRGTWRLRY